MQHSPTQRGYTLYMFFETKNSLTMQGDIGVALSADKGATWKYLGIALDEEWHLSYPYVFNYQGQIYLMPEGNRKGDLRLYRALEFPLRWTLEKVLIKKPLIDATMIQYEGYYWIFGSDFTRYGTEKNAELEIWYSRSPLGPWKQHKQNPVHSRDKSLGARNAGRPFIYEGSLYRSGQDCGETYGRRVRMYKVEILSTENYREVEVPLGIEESKKGRNAWNGIRYHHLDAQQLPSGDWIALMDGDRVPSGDSSRRLFIAFTGLTFVLLLITAVGFSVGCVMCMLPTSWGLGSNRRNDTICVWVQPQFSLKLRKCFIVFNRTSSSLQGQLRLNTCLGKSILCILSTIGVVAVCVVVSFLFGGNGAEEAYPFKGEYSQFTMLTMTYEARLWNLKLYVKHYSRCASVREIVVVWNKGNPPDEREFDSAVPVRIRVERLNSLNNRFKVDPLIKTRAVLELDDDIMMTCNDLERGFKVWREHPERLVGFYPRLVNGKPLQYRNERYARKMNGYNMILTGAAFMDGEIAFKRYWSEMAKEGRAMVDKFFNCEDVLMNFIYANLSSARTVEYVHPAWAIDTSKFSSAAISRDTGAHYRRRTSCLVKFTDLYGPLPAKEWEFGMRVDGWDA
ncbi:glucosamine inositolphosphorylceramide transferase 1-like isoform X2 [Nymphaea colorata]|uniref:glucosamine inositolphosphorylceramide transferase 1-like isoform X2 n=1 Tax=Nymphaea colorata TaxID=210225 RepID=UPI00129DA3C9|nr:glucosamine inositolphosphorylceramide transferase 1-like isoform X2 [Nymphaea colorata]XP_031488809.1 glucosamine inositolphosphorylceramide transferase 1-like isoform X2 [Nymphaea colorata]